MSSEERLGFVPDADMGLCAARRRRARSAFVARLAAELQLRFPCFASRWMREA